MCSSLSPASIVLLQSLPPSPSLSFSLFLPDRSDIRNLYYQVFPGCWWKSWFATPDWIYLSFIPFQPLASCPSRQEPNSLSILRCQGIKISIYRRRGRVGGRGRRQREGNEERDRVLAHMSRLWTARWWWRGINVLLSSSHSNPRPIPFASLYLLALYIHLSVSKQNMSHPPILKPTSSVHKHIHGQTFQKKLNYSKEVSRAKVTEGIHEKNVTCANWGLLVIKEKREKKYLSVDCWVAVSSTKRAITTLSL